MNAGSNGPHEILKGKAWHQRRLALENLSTTPPDTPETQFERAAALLAVHENEDVEHEGRGFAYGGLGLLAQHTSYYDGFAVVYGTSRLTTIMVRKANKGAGRIFFEDREGRALQDEEAGSGEVLASVPSHQVPTKLWAQLVEQLIDDHLGRGIGVDVAVVTSIPAGCLEAALSALAVSVVKALYDFKGASLPEDIIESLRKTIERVLEFEFSKAFVMVSRDAEPGTLCIIDTATEELIPFEAPGTDHLRWGLIDVGPGSPKELAFYRTCGEMGKKALSLLQKTEFSDYTSFRDVQHEDLPRVLSVLPSQYRTIVRHLVNENKRVQLMIGAIRRADWQKLGGLLFISHSSVSSEWKGSSRAIDYVVSAAEQMSSEGIYGACMTGRGGQVLVVGLPLALPEFMANMENHLASQFKHSPRSLIV